MHMNNKNFRQKKDQTYFDDIPYLYLDSSRRCFLITLELQENLKKEF